MLFNVLKEWFALITAKRIQTTFNPWFLFVGSINLNPSSSTEYTLRFSVN